MDPVATRKNYSRNGLRYQSDVTDEEWRVIEPYLPPAKRASAACGVVGRCSARSSTAFSTWMRSGCPWRQLPKGPSALEHGLSLVCSLARCLPVREDQPCAGR